MTIRLLDSTLINRIAAGEVIERPASAVKELVENALDAQANRIDVILRDGGKSLIAVVDNGTGMTPDDLQLSVERHATSKLPDDDLFNIRSMGFRGEALASIGAVSRLSLTSRMADMDTAWRITVEGGSKHPLEPVSGSFGTRVEIRDLFYATPARLKFLKGASTEVGHIRDILERLALANPHIHFTLGDGDKVLLDLPAEETLGEQRLTRIFGGDFWANSEVILEERSSLSIRGFTSIPTYNVSNTTHQYFYVNGRPVKDKLLSMAIRVAYQDFLPPHRHPLLVLFVDINPEDVDINVHPAKAEVRFRESQQMRGSIINALRSALNAASHRTSTTISNQTISYMESAPESSEALGVEAFTPPQKPSQKPYQAPLHLYSGVSTTAPSVSSPPPSARVISRVAEMQRPYIPKPSPAFMPAYSPPSPLKEEKENTKEKIEENSDEPLPSALGTVLGIAKAQIHQTYIISETPDALILVDQHAAHERLLYEKIKAQIAAGSLKRQTLLIPEIVELPDAEREALLAHQEALKNMGFSIDLFGKKAIILREAPAILGTLNYTSLIKDIASELQGFDHSTTLITQIYERLATHACHHSIRAGQTLSFESMNALLREMESTPHSGQCNHGRPTYITLKKEDLEKLFGRR